MEGRKEEGRKEGWLVSVSNLHFLLIFITSSNRITWLLRYYRDLLMNKLLNLELYQTNPSNRISDLIYKVFPVLILCNYKKSKKKKCWLVCENKFLCVYVCCDGDKEKPLKLQIEILIPSLKIKFFTFTLDNSNTTTECRK